MRMGTRLILVSGLLLGCNGIAQETKSPPWWGVDSERTIFLKNVGTQAEQNEILTAVRNMVAPSTRIFLAPGQSAIIVEGPPDQVLLAEKVIREIDLPRKVFRLTYTLTDLDGGKRVGVQHFAVVVANGQRTQMKQGNRVPLVMGTIPVAGATTATNSTQVTYIDVGLTVDATVDAVENGVGLRTKVEVSSVAGDMTSALSQDPILRQTTLEGTSVLTLGKAVELGSLDVPGSTRHTQVEVVAEFVK